ncbi:MAG: DUF4440 domain-containing protein [Gammaproteobacteria bacterium]|jgi:ketosteroid isomerase-like protein|nr:DUF4440 domain-containing protein [Gammaproteobacteria bacterium]
MFNRLIVLPILITSILMLHAAQAGGGDDIASVMQTFNGLENAIESGDLESLMSFYHHEVVIYPPAKSAIVGTAENRRRFVSRLDKFNYEVIQTADELKIHGDIAHLIGRFRIEGHAKSGEDNVIAIGRHLLLFKRSSRGDWKVYRDIYQKLPASDPLSKKDVE